MSTAVIKAAIVGASGYAGGELIRLLAGHPKVKIVAVSGRHHEGSQVADLFAHLRHLPPDDLAGAALTSENLSPEELARRADVIFTAVPHGAAMEFAAAARTAGKKMIDLGADYRFDSADAYETCYGIPHRTPDLVGEAVYGLPEINREKIKDAWLVGNPGCYPTSVILGLAPLLKAAAQEAAQNSPQASPQTASQTAVDTREGPSSPFVIIDAKSGVSGAGRTPALGYHFPECDENLRPYGANGHRHTPEMEQELAKLAGRRVPIAFTPHLVPMSRGILASIYVHGLASIAARGPGAVQDLYAEAYGNEPFVTLLPAGQLPEVKAVRGSNYCEVAVVCDERSAVVKVFSAIDNLVKGAAGQAVQNMNLMFGLEETLGLLTPPLYP